MANKSVRNLATFAHGEFLDRLKVYAAARGVHVVEVCEAFTTKTCTFCGHLNDVGDRKTIVCASCAKSVDRDFAGARNIALKTAMG